MRDPDHERLLREGEVRTLLAGELDLDAEEIWLTTLAADEWLAEAGCDGDAATRIRDELRGAEVRLRPWRARFVKRP
jgi:hypothetical protein